MLKQIVFLLLFFVPLLHAADVDHLYQAEVSVADQGQQERNRAIAEGFRQMLVKVTGNRNIAQNQSLAEAFSKASRYVQQYRYRVETGDADSAAPAAEKRYLRITFDKLAVDRTLRANGLSVWGKSRPQVIVWAGFDSAGSRKLLMPDFDQSTMSMFNRAADSRGIPLLFPVMDLQDQSAISASDLWGTFEGPVTAASDRYQADAILMVRVKSTSNGFIRSSWSFLANRDTRQWEFNGKSLNNVVWQGLNAIADHLAAIYAPAGGSDSQLVNMQVSGLDTFAEMLKVEVFLENQETVREYHLRQSQSDKVIFSLALRGGMQSFVQAVELSGLFEAEDMMFSAQFTEPVVEPEPVPAVTMTMTTDLEDKPQQDAETIQAGQDDMVTTVLHETSPQVPRDPLTDIHLYYRLR